MNQQAIQTCLRIKSSANLIMFILEQSQAEPHGWMQHNQLVFRTVLYTYYEFNV